MADLVGRTPLIELAGLSPNPDVRLFAKLESANPSGSVKDRVAWRILEQARASGALAPGQTVIEASTGNTGLALAMFGRVLGHPVEVCVPESVYPEIAQRLTAYGARIRWVPRQDGIRSAHEAARALAAANGAYLLDQFGSQQNLLAHYEGTAVEILEALPRVDAFVAGVGTGGTISGVGRRLKEANPQCRVVAVEPRLGVHVQGLKSLADGWIPPILDESVLDGRIIVGNRHAVSHAKRVMLATGLFVGVSSGAVMHGALRVASRLGRGNIVLMFADDGSKYVGTELWAADAGADNAETSDPLDDVLWW
ncbi:MAG: cysteine synthase family protein [Chloroflexi bacterium]|nr:cysteine synthase family protein [Chloroflexota bacterium]